MPIAEWLHILTTALHSGKTGVFAIRGGISQRNALRRFLQQAGVVDVVLQPPLPWEPLAPLRHLCDHLQHPFPTWESIDTDLLSLSLGAPVILHRYFQRILENWPNQPILAWIDATDFSTTIWQEFLQLACHGVLHIPVCFAHMLLPGQSVPNGVKILHPDPLPLDSLHPSHSSHPKIKHRMLQYLAQILFWGDRVNFDAMRAVSRTRHDEAIQQLQHQGLLSSERCVVLEKLRDLPPLPFPHSRTWRTKVLRYLARVGSIDVRKQIWLMYGQTPILSNPACFSEQTWIQNMLHIGATAWLPHLISLSSPKLPAMIRLAVEMSLFPAYRDHSSLLSCASPSEITELLNDPLLTTKHATQSWVGQVLGFVVLGKHTHREHIGVIEQCYQVLQSHGPSWAATLVALYVSRWYLGSGRLAGVFPLLQPHLHEPHWAIQWQLHQRFAEAYHRMGRVDLARNHIEKAVAVAPKPMSPLLQAELRLISAKWLLLSEQTEDAEVQLQEARNTFLAAGDGARLGHYFLILGEYKWKQQQWEEARGLLGRSLDLCRRYRDALGALEAQLKLGLVIREAPFELLSPIPLKEP